MALIDRDKLLEDLKTNGYNPDEYEEDSLGEAWAKGFNAGIAHAIHDVIHTPEVEAAPVVYGEWRFVRCSGMDDVYGCTRCGQEMRHLFLSRYCPCCGAKMTVRR